MPLQIQSTRPRRPMAVPRHRQLPHSRLGCAPSRIVGRFFQQSTSIFAANVIASRIAITASLNGSATRRAKQLHSRIGLLLLALFRRSPTMPKMSLKRRKNPHTTSLRRVVPQHRVCLQRLVDPDEQIMFARSKSAAIFSPQTTRGRCATLVALETGQPGKSRPCGRLVRHPLLKLRK